MSDVLLRTGLFLIAGWLAAAVAMACLLIAGRALGNHGIVDVGWTYLVGTLGIAFAVAGPGAPSRRVAVAALFGVWAVRLGTYLLRDRVLGRPEDGRYTALRRQWGATADRRFFWFYQAQALAAVFFALPAIAPSMNPTPALGAVEWWAMGLWLVALAGETLADWQLVRFKADAAHRGTTCRAGLWHYSRHPNYFFEWLIWVALALFASASPTGAIAFLCPLAMLYLLFKVTGIPATEEQAVRSRGDDYRDYQSTTSAFVPWWPRPRAVTVPPKLPAH